MILNGGDQLDVLSKADDCRFRVSACWMARCNSEGAFKWTHIIEPTFYEGMGELHVVFFYTTLRNNHTVALMDCSSTKST